MIIDDFSNPKRKLTVSEASAANDYFTRRKSEEDRIAGIKAPAKNKKNPANTDYAKRRKQQDVTEASLNEFAPNDDGDDSSGDGPDQEELLRRLAAHWWNGTEQQMFRVEHTLAAMGWEIGEDEGYDDGGVFVVRAGDEHGRSYLSWPHEDLEMNEVAPPGAKAERMVKHIKQGYAKDGKLTPKEKGIAFATAWKAHNAGQVEEGRPFRGTGGAFNRGDDERHDLDPSDWYIVKDGKMFAASIYPRQVKQAEAEGFSRTKAEARARAGSQGVAEGKESPEKEIERLKLRQDAEHGHAPLRRQAATQARIRELEKQIKGKQGVAEGSELKQAKRKYNQAAKDANADQVGAGKKIDTMKNSLRQKDVDNKKQDVAEGSSTMWEVSFDYGPHMSETVKVKAGSEEEAIAKVEKAAEKRGRSIMVNWAKTAEQGVAESAPVNTTPEFTQYVYSKLRNHFTDLAQVEDLFDYAYLSDVTLGAISDAMEENGTSAKQELKERLTWLLKNINDRKYKAVIKPIAVEWMKLVAPTLGQQGVAEGEYDSRKPFGVRYKVFAGREGRMTTREYWTTSEEKLQKAVDKIQALDNFYEIDGYSYPKESQGVTEVFADQGSGSSDRDNAEYMKRRKAAKFNKSAKPYKPKNQQEYDAIEKYRKDLAQTYNKPKKEQGVAEGLPGGLSKSDYTPGATKKHVNTNCTTCHGRKGMYKLDGKLFADNKVGAVRVKCPACHGTGDKPDVSEAKNLKKRVKIVKGPDTGKTGWIREIKHGAFKGAPKSYYIDLDDGGQANNLPGAALRLIKDQSLSENAEDLHIGDPVIITGNGIKFEGATGEIVDFGRDNRFVVVNLYNHGRHSFHSSDVSFNEYAGSDDEEARMYDAGEFGDDYRDEMDEAEEPMQSPEQIAYNQLRAQWDGYQAMTSGGGNTYVSRDPAHAAKLATIPAQLAKMSAALKAKGIDAEADYNAIGGPKAAPVDINQQYVDEVRMSAAQRLSNAWDKQRAKSNASLARTPSSIPKKEEPKKADPVPKTVSEHRTQRRALMAQMLNSH